MLVGGMASTAWKVLASRGVVYYTAVTVTAGAAWKTLERVRNNFLTLTLVDPLLAVAVEEYLLCRLSQECSVAEVALIHSKVLYTVQKRKRK